VSIDHLLADSWRREIIARSKPYAPPDTAIDDVSGECVCLQLNALWTPFITGVLSILLNPNLWDHTDPSYAPQEIIKLLEQLDGGNTLSCPTPVTNVTFEGGVITLHYSDESTTVVQNSETIVTGIGAIGNGWEVEQAGEFSSVTGECGDCEAYPEKPAYEGTANDLRACAIATGVTTYVMDKYQDFLDQADVYANAVDVVQAALKLVFPPSYIFFAPAVELVKAFFDIGIASCRTFDTVEWRDEFAEALYCFIRSNDYTLEAAQWETFRTNFIDPNAPAIVEQYLHTINSEAIEDQAHKQSYNEEGSCVTFSCGGCFGRIVDFTVENPACAYPRSLESGCYSNTDWAAFSNGVGWQSVVLTGGSAGCGQFNRLQLIVDMGEVKNVTNIRYLWSIQAGTPGQEEVFSSNDLASFTSRYQGNEAAGDKSTAVSFSSRYLLFVIEQSVSDPPAQLPSGTWTIEEIEITVA